MRRPVLAVLALALLAGCALVTTAPPEVEAAAVELRGLGLFEQVLGVTLCVTNPNRTELAFRRVTVAVDAAGAPLAEGASDVPVAVPPLSSALVPFTVVTTVRNLGPQLLGVVRASGLEYRLRETVTLAGSLGLTIPFSRGGRLGLLAAGQELLADAIAPSTLRCSAGLAL